MTCPLPNGVTEAFLTQFLRSIVNGLRDDDGESFYGDRASFYSEYSMKDESNVKVFFKEHERKSSKGSVNSFLSRKKSQQQAKGTARPETKVCFHFHVTCAAADSFLSGVLQLFCSDRSAYRKPFPWHGLRVIQHHT